MSKIEKPIETECRLVWERQKVDYVWLWKMKDME
jgi:hypothetical protein